VPAKSAQAAQWVKPTAAAAASSVPVIAVPTLHLSGTIPPDLVKQGPRQVTFNHSSGRQSPESWQKLMLLLPFVWMFLVMGYLALGPDNDLRTKGIDYPATVFAYSYIIPNTNFASVRGPLYQVILSYKVNGVPYTIFTGAGADDIGKYKVGSQFAVPVHAMPTNPTYREDLGAQAGARQRHDVMVCMLCTLVNFLLEAAIWIPAINQRDLAQYGVAVLARVDRLKREAKTNGLASYTEYTAEVSFLPPGNTFPVTREVRVSKEQHFSLTAGNTEVMLCKQNNPDEPKFYRFCRYRAVP
jgi:hypothetical protein